MICWDLVVHSNLTTKMWTLICDLVCSPCVRSDFFSLILYIVVQVLNRQVVKSDSATIKVPFLLPRETVLGLFMACTDVIVGYFLDQANYCWSRTEEWGWSLRLVLSFRVLFNSFCTSFYGWMKSCSNGMLSLLCAGAWAWVWNSSRVPSWDTLYG